MFINLETINTLNLAGMIKRPEVKLYKDRGYVLFFAYKESESVNDWTLKPFTDAENDVQYFNDIDQVYKICDGLNLEIEVIDEYGCGHNDH